MHFARICSCFFVAGHLFQNWFLDAQVEPVAVSLPDQLHLADEDLSILTGSLIFKVSFPLPLERQMLLPLNEMAFFPDDNEIPFLTPRDYTILPFDIFQKN